MRAISEQFFQYGCLFCVQLIIGIDKMHKMGIELSYLRQYGLNLVEKLFLAKG